MAQALGQLHKSIGSPTISVVVPVRNEVSVIRACIEGILNQSVKILEIIAVDSGSTDGTLEILKEYPIVKIIEIDPSEFNHGETRNLGFNNSVGEFVLLTVADAWASSNDLIEKLLQGFVDEEVMAVCGSQIVPHNKKMNPVQWFRPVSKPKIRVHQFKNANDFLLLNPRERKKVCSWDDVNALYRRDALRKVPFRKTSYSEDAQWALDAILKGFKIAYNPAARMFHYHSETEEFSYKRMFTTKYFSYRLFGLKPDLLPEPQLKQKISWIKSIIKAGIFNPIKIFYWYKYNLLKYSARRKAVLDFYSSLLAGEEFLDKEHQRICGKPPIPSKT